MNSQQNITRFQRVDLANRALLLNARVNVIEQISGLTRRELEKVFYDRPQFRVNSGKNPASEEWFLSANIIVSFHLATFYSMFRAIESRGISPSEALVASYQKYLARFAHDIRIDFDRAFLLVSFVDGYWTKKGPLLQMVECNDCRGSYIGALGENDMSRHPCPLCKVANTFERNARVSVALTQPILRNIIESLDQATT